ncbi:MAG: hypothetical protein AAF609_05315 [Cyanobacteria bacterium P01_C01_bin.120]
MPSPNDLSAQPVQVLINNGTDDLDVSNAFQQFELSAGEFTRDGWWRPTGKLTLAAQTDSGESFDPKANYSRWQPDNLVSVSVDFGGGWVPLPIRLKIRKLPGRPRRGQQRIELQLAGDPTLLSYRSPEGDAGGATYGTSTNRKTLINAILNQAGHPEIGTDTLSAHSLRYAPEKKTGGSWVDWAGALAWSANHILWQQTDGAVRVAELSPTTISALPPFAHYIVGSTESRYEPQDPTDTPPDRFKGAGTGLLLTDITNDPQEFENIVNGVTVTTRITYSGQGGRFPSKTVEIRKPRNVILPKVFTSSDPSTDTETTTADTYSAIDGKLLQTVITTREPIAKVFPERSWGSSLSLVISSEKTVSYEYDSDNVVRGRTIDLRRAKYTGSVILADYQYIDERWRKRGSNYDYTRDVTNEDDDASNAPKVGNPPTSDAPPATKYQPPATTKDQEDYAAELTVASSTGSGYMGKPEVITLPGGLAVSNSQTMDVIKLWASIRHGRQWPIAWAAPLTQTWLENFNPIRRIDFTEGNTRTAYLVDALQMVLTNRTRRVGGTTIELGEVALDGTGPITPPFTVTEV